MIIEDEALVRDLLVENVGQVPFIKLTRACGTASEAIESLQSHKIDLIFLDIHLPGLSGLQFLKSLNAPPMVIMVTAYQNYAVEAFDLNVVDYILKPFTFERVLKACHKASQMNSLKMETSNITHGASRHLFVNSEYALVRIVVDDIIYIEGMKDYIKIHLSSSANPVITRMTLKSILDRLPVNTFIRTHKSFVVAASKITAIKRDFVCVSKSEVPVSESFREDLLRFANRR